MTAEFLQTYSHLVSFCLHTKQVDVQEAQKQILKVCSSALTKFGHTDDAFFLASFGFAEQ